MLCLSICWRGLCPVSAWSACASASVYNLFIFQYAGKHSTEIIVGAGILYFVGFGLMCLKVKEGQYPPAPAYIDGQSGPFAGIKTFFKECHSLRHYWYVFLSSFFNMLALMVGTFMLFFYQSTGLSLVQIGRIRRVCQHCGRNHHSNLRVAGGSLSSDTCGDRRIPDEHSGRVTQRP